MEKFVLLSLKVFLVGILLASSSCEEDKIDPASCGFENPLEEVQWLKELVSGFDISQQAAGAKVYSYSYNGNQVFLVNPCVNCADGLTYVYDCLGEKICEFGGIDGRNTCPDFQDSATDEVLLFSTSCDDQVALDKDLYQKESSFFTIVSALISGDCLQVTYSSSGCSGDSWDIKLVDAEEVLESFPIQRNIRLILDNQEACQAVFTRTISFDISPLQTSPYNQVSLNLDEFDQQLIYVYDAQDLFELNTEWSLVKLDGGLMGTDASFDQGLITWVFDENEIEVVNSNQDQSMEDAFDSGTYSLELSTQNNKTSIVVDGQNLGFLTIVSADEFWVDARPYDGFRLVFKAVP